MKQVYYWSPFVSKVATATAVINSAYSLNRYSNNEFAAIIIDVMNEWRDYKNDILKKKISLLRINQYPFFNVFNNYGFIKSRLTYIYIFLRSIFPLHNLIKNKKPEYLIIHLITSLPLILFIINNYETKLILRISGYPKMTSLRKLIWRLAINKIHKISCPTLATYNSLSKFKFLKKKLVLLRDPVLNIKDISQKLSNFYHPDLHNLKKIIENKKLFLSVGRFTRQKNFIFYLNCINDIVKKYDDLLFIFIGEGEQKKKFELLVDKLNLGDFVHIINYSNNIPSFMRMSNALVLTSLWEDPGFVIVEAGYNNCLVISSDCPNGPTEIIGNNGGYLFNTNSKISLLKKFDEFMNEDRLKKNNKKINIKKNIKNFTCFRHAKNLIKGVL